MVFVRDSESLQFVTACSPTVNFIQSPDFTNLVKGRISSTFINENNIKEQSVAIIPNSKMLGKDNANKSWETTYVKLLQTLIEQLQSRNVPVFLLNHEGKSDAVICLALNEKLATTISIVSPANCLEIKAIIGQCQWVVSSRFHGCVSALSQHIPCLSTSWSHKYEELFSEYGHSEWLLSSDLTAEDINALVDEQLANNKVNSASLAEPSNHFKNQANQMWEVISQKINSK